VANSDVFHHRRVVVSAQQRATALKLSEKAFEVYVKAESGSAKIEIRAIYEKSDFFDVHEVDPDRKRQSLCRLVNQIRGS
jgi:hypothetical protein